MPLTIRHLCRIFASMKLRNQLITVSDAFGTATSRSRARVSTLVFNQGQRLAKIADCQLDPTISSFERAMQWFSDNWPPGVEWPTDVARPMRSFEDQEAA